jgi:DHA1 family tetracycline resistance protein-like MFS transporter
MGFAPTLGWLFVGRALAGLFGASFGPAGAAMADLSTPEERARHFGMIGAAFGVGFVIGPILGSLLSKFDPRFPFWFAAGLALLNFSYGLFVLPESLPPEKRTAKFDWAHANPFGSLMLLKQYPQVFGLAAVVFLANLAHYVYPSIFVLLADYRYGWEEDQVGWVLGAVGVCSIIVNVVLVGRLVKALGERRALLLGLGCGVIGFLVYAFADVGWVFLIGLPISAVWAIAAPATQAIITRQVGAGVQGRIQGALMSLTSLGGIIGPAIFAGSFGYFIGPHAPVHLPGAPWFAAALLLGLGVVIAWRYARVAPLAAAPSSIPNGPA